MLFCKISSNGTRGFLNPRNTAINSKCQKSKKKNGVCWGEGMGGSYDCLTRWFDLATPKNVMNHTTVNIFV